MESPSFTQLLTTICLLTLDRWQLAAQPSTAQQLFKTRRNASDGLRLCCLEAPVAILQVRSTTECAVRCTQASFNCSHFNAKTSEGGRSCELYPYSIMPACYGQLTGCTNYEVGITDSLPAAPTTR